MFTRYVSGIVAVIALVAPLSASALAITVKGDVDAKANVGQAVSASTTAGAHVDMDDEDDSATSSEGNAGGEVRGLNNALIHVTANDAEHAIAVITNLLDVRSDADVSAFAQGEIKGDARIKEMNASDDEVSVTYKEPAHFLGLFSASLPVTASAKAMGALKVHYPWYAFLYSAPKSADIQASVAAQVDTSATTTFTAQEKARILALIHQALKVSAEASASAQ